MKDIEVFRCNIRFLSFNIPCEDDEVCQNAVKAVQDAENSLFTDDNVMKYVSIKEGMRYYQKLQQNPHEAREMFLDNDIQLMYDIVKREKTVDFKEIFDPCAEVRILLNKY